MYSVGSGIRAAGAPNSVNRLTAVDAIRGFAALLVVLPHSTGFFALLPSDAWSRQFMEHMAIVGRLGVDVFFVLSGFVIALTSSGRRLTFQSVPRFLARRLVRLAPPYWVGLGVMLGCLGLQARYGHAVGQFPDARRILANVIYAQDLLGIENINVVYWTLCLEVQFYFAFAIASACAHGAADLLKIDRFHIAVTGLVLSAIGSLALMLWWTAIPALRGTFVFHWHEFALGILACVMLTRASQRIERVVVAEMAVMALASIWLHRWETLTAVATSVAIIHFGRRHTLETRWNQPLPQYLGMISYSLYLIHVPVIFVCLAIYARFNRSSTPASWLMFACTLAAALAVAHVMQRFVEQPALQLSRRFRAA